MSLSIQNIFISTNTRKMCQTLLLKIITCKSKNAFCCSRAFVSHKSPIFFQKEQFWKSSHLESIDNFSVFLGIHRIYGDIYFF